MGAIDIVAIVLSILTLGAALAVLAITVKKSGVNPAAHDGEELIRRIEELKNICSQNFDHQIKIQSSEFERIKDSILNLEKNNIVNLGEIRSENQKSLGALNEAVKSELGAIKESSGIMLLANKEESLKSLDKLRELFEQKTSALEAQVEKSLNKINEDNMRKLDEMQKIIDEKLQTALEKRITESFKIVTQQLDVLNKSIGEVQAMSGDVKRFNNILSGTKQMGNWGEIMLESLLDQILSKEQYYTQYSISGKNAVDFAIRMPGKGDKEVLLPIDCKFPVTNFESYLRACDEGDAHRIKAARGELIAFIKQQATDIKNKYVYPPKTTDFAIMYLPTESLFAEVIKEPGLTIELQEKSKVVICGPTTIAALLNSLELGFKTLVIQKSSAEIFKALTQFRKDFETFDEIINKTRNYADNIIKQMDDADKRTSLIGKRLVKLDKFESEKLLGESDD